jgi:hypothetical protein
MSEAEVLSEVPIIESPIVERLACATIFVAANLVTILALFVSSLICIASALILPLGFPLLFTLLIALGVVISPIWSLWAYVAIATVIDGGRRASIHRPG